KDLRRYVARNVTPRDATFKSFRHGHNGIEVSTGDAPESQDESDQHCPGWNRVRQKSKGEISARELFRHDAGTDNRSNQKSGACKFGDGTLTQRVLSHGLDMFVQFGNGDK